MNEPQLNFFSAQDFYSGRKPLSARKRCDYALLGNKLVIVKSQRQQAGRRDHVPI
jgi:hypothetical protein